MKQEWPPGLSSWDGGGSQNTNTAPQMRTSGSLRQEKVSQLVLVHWCTNESQHFKNAIPPILTWAILVYYNQALGKLANSLKLWGWPHVPIQQDMLAYGTFITETSRWGIGVSGWQQSSNKCKWHMFESQQCKYILCISMNSIFCCYLS